MDDARKDALDVLGDVAKWRLAADHWPPVASVLRELADAAATDDVKVLIRATAALEAICPHRISMIDSGVPVPRSLRLRLDTLVHALTGSPEQTGPMVGSRAGVRVPPPRLGPAVPRQELVLHAFVALDGPWAQPAYRELRAVWTRARRTLGATAALDGTAPPPTDLPEDCALLTTGPLLAGRQRPDRTAQVVIRREHDVLVLSIGWRIEPGIARPAWPALRGQRTEILDGVTDGFLGAVEILTGTCEVTHQADVLSRLADGADDLWTGDGASHGGVTLWELPPSDDHARAWRQLLALAPVRDHAELSALLWSDRSPALPPLARYLLDAAKVRYELRIRLAASDPLRATVERGGEADLAVLASQLESMRRTVDIAASNMTAVVDVSAGLFDDDRLTTAWMRQMLDDDLHYVGEARERVRYTGAVTASPAPVVALVTAMPEEYLAMATLLDDAREHRAENDTARYTLGTVPSGRHDRPHRVVLTMLGATAGYDAAAAVTHLVRSFATVSQVVMVGIAAGIPAPTAPHRHVRLGDIVVATWGVVDYDHVVDRPEGVTLRVTPPRPSYLLSQAAKTLEVDELRQVRPWEADLDRLIDELPQFARPAPDTDVLYVSDDDGAEPVVHPDRPDSSTRPKVHYGRIGSANRSLRNISVRDSLADDYDLRAVEMEGSGVSWAAHANDRGWIVVRGISDYADSRMAMGWRRYASAVAAAYTRALLERCVTVDPRTTSG